MYTCILLLLGVRKSIRPVKIVIRCCCGYLSGARCRFFAYDPTDSTAIHKPRHLLQCVIQIQTGFTFLVPAYPGCPGKDAVKRMQCVVVVYYYWQWSHTAAAACGGFAVDQILIDSGWCQAARRSAANVNRVAVRSEDENRLGYFCYCMTFLVMWAVTTEKLQGKDAFCYLFIFSVTSCQDGSTIAKKTSSQFITS